jgi:predicted dienelactone hydrolase
METKTVRQLQWRITPRVAFFALVLVAFMGFAVPAEAAVGFQRLTYTDSGGVPVEAGIWYPSEGQETREPLELYEQDVVRNGPVRGKDLPLVVVSHGTGGSLAGHFDTALALAKAGFVVAALTHPGDNYRDNSRAFNITDRPRQVGELLSFMLDKWDGHAAISARRIGAFGFSAGGFTTLALIGGRYDLRLIEPHCDSHPSEYTCQLVAANAASVQATAVLPPGAEGTDARIRAAVIAAPALGFTFTQQGLSDVRVPLLLWRAADDQVLPQPFYAQAVYDALPVKPRYVVVPHAGHYDFLAPCSDALARRVPNICTSEPEFDRAAFHRQFDAAIVDFFNANLQGK